MSTVIVTIWLLWMSLLDIKSRRAPTWLIVGGGMLALLVSYSENFLEIAGKGTWWSYAGTLLGGMVPGICLLLLAIATKTVGWGDGVVLSLLGALMGFRESLLVLCVGLFLAALSSVVLLALKRANRNTCLPFLPFLSMGWFLVGMT